MSDKELDNIFKSKLTNREFEFNPDNWEAMENILDNQSKSGMFYLWSSAAIVSFGLLTFAALLFNNGSTPASALPAENMVNQEFENTKPEEVKDAEQFPDTFENDNKVQSISDNAAMREEAEGLNVIGAENTASYKPVTSNETSVNLLNTEATVNEPEKLSVLNNTTETPVVFKEFTAPLELTEKTFTIPVIEENGSEQNITSALAIDPSSLKKFKKQHELWIQAGPDFSLSNANSNASAAWFAGLNYRHRFSQRWNINLGLDYYAKKTPGIFLSSDSIFYNFGQEVIRTEVENKRLDYIGIPFEIGFDINAQHQFTLGGYTAFLINVNRQIKQTYFHFKGNQVVTESNENGLSSNFNNVDYGLSAGYNYQYSPQLSLGLQMKYGFTDITRNRTEVLNPHHNNVHLRIMLRYLLF